jgi:large subunit ribosomal protein L4
MQIETLQGSVVEANSAVFDRRFNEPLVHQVVNAFLAGARSGSKAQKTRAQVAGGGRKPWRQKGTGRARVGSIRSPIWRGGGRAFAASPRSFSQKVNRKMYRGAVCAILSELNRRGCLVVAEEFSLELPKTRVLVEKLRELSLESVLIVDSELSDNLVLAGNNLPLVGVIEARHVDPVNLLRFAKVLLTRRALSLLEERLS